MSSKTAEPSRGKKILLGAAVFVAAFLVLGVLLLFNNIDQRKQEAADPYFKSVELTDTTVDPAVWGRNFPIQYDAYMQTLTPDDGVHGGSEALPTITSAEDPRAGKAEQKLEVDPRLVSMWAGYPFSQDYRELRGHAYMLHDQRVTKRVEVVNQPGACLNCHASTYVMMKELGNGDINAGFDVINRTPFNEIQKQAEHPVACIDCHDPQTMKLRITRPAFMRGIAAKKAAEGVTGYDVNRDASSQEMRSYVCAQCHVEYYFKGDGKTLTFPWAKGVNIDNEYAYYEEEGFTDWTHQTTNAPMLKAQHPEFEMWNQGVHASAGVSCSDCHMPYQRVGAQKVSDHRVSSPMRQVNNACLTCHSTSEEEMRSRVETIQQRHIHTRDSAQNALDDLIKDLEAAQAAGNVPPERIAAAQQQQRKASFYIDWVVSENSMGFHAPGEAQRILSDAADAARQGQLILLGREGTPAAPVRPAPDKPVAPAAEGEAHAQPAAATQTPAQ